MLGNLLLCFGGVRVGQSFVLLWWGSCWAIFYFVLVGFVLGNLLLCFGGVRVGQSFVLFWWGSCWAIFYFLYSVL